MLVDFYFDIFWVWNGLIGIPLFLMGKFVSRYEFFRIQIFQDTSYVMELIKFVTQDTTVHYMIANLIICGQCPFGRLLH